MTLDPISATAALIDSLGAESLAKASAYTAGGHWLLFWGLAVSGAVCWLFVRSAILEKLDRRLAERARALRDLILCATYLLVAALLTLPWTLYSEWFRESHYGRSSQPLGDFLGQWAIGTLVSGVLAALFLTGVYALIRRSGRRWWLWCGGLTAFAMSALLLLGPVLIEPLFNRYEPLPAGSVRDALEGLAREAGIAEDRIVVYDGSRQSNNFTANVSGIGGSARIAISDIALKGASIEEVQAVTGHEIGHYVSGHIWRLIGLVSLLAVGVFWAAGRLFPAVARGVGCNADIADPVSLPVLVFLIGLLAEVCQPPLNALSRSGESEADRYSLEHVGLPDALASALLKTAEYRDPRPHPLQESLFYSHPSVERRILAAMRWKAGQGATLAATTPDTGETAYQRKCAACHDNPQNNVPPRASLAYRSPEAIQYALTEGSMKPMAADLSPADIDALVLLLAGRPARPLPDLTASACTAPAAPLAVSAADWTGNGGGDTNTRFRDNGWLDADSTPHLQIRQVLGYPGGAGGPPVLAGERMFLPAGFGFVLSVDAGSGCTHWAFRRPGRIVRSLALSGPTGGQARPAIYFGDDQAWVTALDAETGKELWQTRVEENVLSRVTGSPLVHDGKVLVPISSIEDPMTHVGTHACCSSRGGLAALDAASGKVLWKLQHISGERRSLPPEKDGAPPRSGPAGAATYVPLALDARRGLVYASTAEEYGILNPPGPYSVIAYDIASGERRWAQQFLPAGAEREAACRAIGETDCRNLFSMGTAPLIHTFPDGRQLILAGQKWGYVYAMDPDEGGRVLWQRKVARGGDMGGVIYGLASDGERIFVPVSDVDAPEPGAAGSLLALDPATGKTLWRREGPTPACSWSTERCTAAQIAALTVVPGAVFGGFNDGWVRAFSTEDGSLLWELDTAREFQTVNGIPARGGQVAGYPVVVGRSALYVTSGASSVERPGNALLMLTVAGP